MRLKSYPGILGILFLFFFILESCWGHEDSNSNATTSTLSDLGIVRVKREHGASGCVFGASSGQSPAGGSSGGGGVDVIVSTRAGRRKRSPIPTPLDFQSDVYVPSSNQYPEIRSSRQAGSGSGSIPGSTSRSNTGSGRILTSAQAFFDYINHNVGPAVQFRQYLQVRNPRLAKRVVINPSGVTCQDTCADPSSRVGFIGLCTSDFCLCHQDARGHDELRCVFDKVFDPLTLRCKDPRDTVLCSDNPPTRDYDYGQYPDSNSVSYPDSYQNAYAQLSQASSRPLNGAVYGQ